MEGQIKLLYDLVQKLHYSSAIKHANYLLDRIRNKNRTQDFENVLIILGLRGVSHLKAGNYVRAEADMDGIMSTRPLSEDVLIILWHYYVANTNIFNTVCSEKLKCMAEHFQSLSSAEMLSEQFEVDLLSLYYYLGDYKTMKVLCNRYYKKYKNPYYLAINVFISYSIFQSQTDEVDNPIREEDLLTLLVDKYLSTVGSESNNHRYKNQLNEKRVVSMINLIKLFVLRRTHKFDLYHSAYNELFSGVSENASYYDSLIPGKLGLLRTLTVLEEHEYAVKNQGDGPLISHCSTLFKLLQNETVNEKLEWDRIRLINYFISKSFEYAIGILYSQEREDSNSNDVNVAGAVYDTQQQSQSLQSLQLTNSSSFQTQSTISSIYNSNNYGEVDGTYYRVLDGTVFLEDIFGVISTISDDFATRFQESKDKIFGLFASSRKGKILMSELFSQILMTLSRQFQSEDSLSLLSLLRNGNCDVMVKHMVENMVNCVNNQITSIMNAEYNNSNNSNAIIDLKVLLNYYFKVKNLSYENNIVYMAYNDLSSLLDGDVIKVNPMNWNYYTNRLNLLILYNQYRHNATNEALEEHNFKMDQILKIFNNITCREMTEVAFSDTDVNMEYICFLISLSIYCLCVPCREDRKVENYDNKSVFLYILVFMNNNLLKSGKDRNNNYFLYSIISELCPLVGLYSVSHYIRREILDIKRSQNTTLYTYSNYSEMMSYPYFFNILGDKVVSSANKDEQDKVNSSFKQNGDSVKLLFNSHMDVLSEIRETYIDSLKGGSFSILNLLDCNKLRNDCLNDNITLITFGIITINKILSLSLSPSSFNSKEDNVLTLISSYEKLFMEFIYQNNDSIIECYKYKVVGQDYSPGLSYFIPIRNVTYQFNHVKNELIPESLFKYDEFLDLEECELAYKDKKMGTDFAEFVYCLPKIKYILTQRLKTWYSCIILFSDIVAAFTTNKDEDSRSRNATISTREELFGRIRDQRSAIFSSKYSKLLLSVLDFELYDNVIVPMLSLFFEVASSVSNSSGGGSYSQTSIRDLVDGLAKLIRDKLGELVHLYIIKQEWTGGELRFKELELFFQNATCLIFGPLLLAILIRNWISLNLPKKHAAAPAKALNNSILSLLREIHNKYSSFISSFNGTIEMKDLATLFTKYGENNPQSDFVLDYSLLLRSQRTSANNIIDAISFLINSMSDHPPPPRS